MYECLHCLQTNYKHVQYYARCCIIAVTADHMGHIGHTHTCLKYHCHQLRHTHTEAQGKTWHLYKHENCTVVKCFTTEYEFHHSMHGILFRHFSYKVVKQCCSVHWTHQSSAKYPGKEAGWTLFTFLMIFKHAHLQALSIICLLAPLTGLKFCCWFTLCARTLSNNSIQSVLDLHLRHIFGPASNQQ